MSDMVLTKGEPIPIEIAPGGYSVQAPNLSLKVEEISAVDHATRSDSGYHEEALIESIGNADMHLGKMFEIAVVDDGGQLQGDDSTRSDGLTVTTREGDAAFVFRMPRLGDTVDHAVLYTDEAGASRWIFPNSGESDQQTIEFYVPRSSPQPQIETADDSGEAQTRGSVSKLGRRLVRVLAWATDPLVGMAAKAIAESWEQRNRPYLFRAVQPGKIGGDVAWGSIKRGRSLLLIHGTFSTAEESFSKLVASREFSDLADYYGQRVFAFNHPSLHHTPSENVDWMLQNIPPGIDADIICHSRGGLVSRALVNAAESREVGPESPQIGRCVLVAAPNRGTVLARGETWFDLIDRYTTLLTNLPDNAFTLLLEGILALVKLVARGGVKGLPGLNAMDPTGSYLDELNSSPVPQSELYAVAADFVPSDPGLVAQFGKTIAGSFVDRIFGEANDGVVPTEGMYATGDEAAGFPISEERRYLISSDIHHVRYFDDRDVNQQIRSWLTRD